MTQKMSPSLEKCNSLPNNVAESENSLNINARNCNTRKMRKILRNNGLEYVTAKGKIVKAKSFSDEDCNCKNKCLSKLGTCLSRKKYFNFFWQIGNFEQQNKFIFDCIHCKAIQLKNKSNVKTVSRIYQIRLENENLTRVCKKMFLGLHGLSNGRLERIIEAANRSCSPMIKDNRGRHTPSNKTSQNDLNFLNEFFILFSSSDSDSKEKAITIASMYNQYKNKCLNHNQNPVSIWVFRNAQKYYVQQFEKSDKLNSKISNCLSENLHFDTNDIEKVCLNNHNHIEMLKDNFDQIIFKNDGEKNCGNLEDRAIIPKSMRKQLRNSGKAYLSQSNKLVRAKVYCEKYCKCNLGCIPNIGTYEERKKVFDLFWQIGDFEKQNVYLTKIVSFLPIKKKLKVLAHEKYSKTCSRIYNLTFQCGEKVKICKTAFLAIHGISNGRLERVLQSYFCQSPLALKDNRGKHAAKNKTSPEKLTHAENHIKTFLQLHIDDADHSTTADGGSSRYKNGLDFDCDEFDVSNCNQMLSERSKSKTNVSKMFKSYLHVCSTENVHPIACTIYRQIVKKLLL